MGRRRSRNSRLRARLRDLGQVPQTGSELFGYFEYVTGQRRIQVENNVPEGGRRLFSVALLPFALSAPTNDPENRLLATISGYSVNGLQERTALDYADFGMFTDTAGAGSNANYFPAIIRGTYSRSGAVRNENKRSAVTNQTYSYLPTRSFSFPFGRTTEALDARTGDPETTIGNVDEGDVATTLQRWLVNGSRTPTPGADNSRAQSVSYDPEVFRNESIQESAPADAIPGISVA